MNNHLFPVLIDLSRKKVILLAGIDSNEDEVLRIMRTLAPCTKHLLVLSPCPSRKLKEEARKCSFLLMEKEYDREDLYGTDVVICMRKDPLLSDDVHAACRTLGIRLCIPAQPARSDFLLPESISV